MAKIDVSQIPGYQEMTPEQKIAALEGFNIADPDMSGFVSKATADKYASEAAAYKKQLREHMTEEEAAKAQREEERKQLQEELAALKRQQQIDRNTTRFVELGYTPEMAVEAATGIEEGNWDAVFLNQKKFRDMIEKNLKAELLKNTPTPPAGDGKVEIDYAAKIDQARAESDFSAMAYYTRLQAEQQNRMK